MISNSFFPFKRCSHVPKTKALEADCRKSPIEAGDSLFRSLLHLFAEIEKTEKQRSQEQNEKTFVRKGPKRQTTSHNHDKTAQCLVIHMPSRVNVDLSHKKIKRADNIRQIDKSAVTNLCESRPFVLHSHLWHREPLKHPHLAHHDLTESYLANLTYLTSLKLTVKIYKLTANHVLFNMFQSYENTEENLKSLNNTHLDRI